MLLKNYIDFKEELTDFECYIVATALETYVEKVSEIFDEILNGTFDFSGIQNRDEFCSFIMYNQIYGRHLIDKFKQYFDESELYES